MDKISVPKISGNLHDEALTAAQAMKENAAGETVHNARAAASALRKLLSEVKSELLAYFKSREKSQTQLPTSINEQFTRELGMVYDIVYGSYAQSFQWLWDMGAVEGEDENVIILSEE